MVVLMRFNEMTITIYLRYDSVEQRHVGKLTKITRSKLLEKVLVREEFSQ